MKKYLIFSVLIGILSFSMQAQIILPKDLEEPIEQALQRSKSIENKQIEISKNDFRIKAVKSLHIPRLEATAAYAYFNHDMTLDIPSITFPITGIELFDDKTKFHNKGQILHGGLMAKSVLFSGFQINNGTKALKEKSKAQELLLETDRDSIMADVITSFDQLRFFKASEILIEDSRKRLKKEEIRVNKAIENGLAVPFERDKIKLARLKLESKRNELEGARKLVYKKLNYLTGLSDIAIKNIVYDLSPILLNENLSVDNKQELEALAHYKKASEYVLKKEKGDFWPKVAAFGGLTYSSVFDAHSTIKNPYLNGQIPNTDLKLNELTLAPNWLVGVGLKWTIFAGTERKNKIKQAELSVKQIDNKLKDSQEKLGLLLDKKMVIYHTKTRQVDIANQQETIAANALNQAKKQYVNGLISISERLEAENDYVKAGQEKSNALMKQREAALNALKVTGKLSQKVQYK